MANCSASAFRLARHRIELSTNHKRHIDVVTEDLEHRHTNKFDAILEWPARSGAHYRPTNTQSSAQPRRRFGQENQAWKDRRWYVGVDFRVGSATKEPRSDWRHDTKIGHVPQTESREDRQGGKILAGRCSDRLNPHACFVGSLTLLALTRLAAGTVIIPVKLSCAKLTEHRR